MTQMNDNAAQDVDRSCDEIEILLRKAKKVFEIMVNKVHFYAGSRVASNQAQTVLTAAMSQADIRSSLSGTCFVQLNNWK